MLLIGNMLSINFLRYFKPDQVYIHLNQHWTFCSASAALRDPFVFKRIACFLSKFVFFIFYNISTIQSYNRNSTIYILGIGAIGCYLGVALKSYRNGVTLLLRSQSRLSEFRDQQNSIVYRRKSKGTNVISDFKASIVEDTADNTPIKSLIICTKSTDTLKATKSIAKRINSHTTIPVFQIATE